jgi:nitrogen fixation protein NifU and related proteins
MELDSLYQQVILDHYKNPHHKGLPEKAIQVHHVNPSCGDEITLSLHINNGMVDDLIWDGVGCSISQASASIMSDLVAGKELKEAFAILDEFTTLMQSKGTSEGNEAVLEDAIALAGVSKFPARVKCALLGWMAFKDAALQAHGGSIATADGEINE